MPTTLIPVPRFAGFRPPTILNAVRCAMRIPSRLLPIPLLLVIVSTARGQIGGSFEAGVAYNKLRTNIDNRPWQQYKPGNGLFVDADMQIYLWKYLFIQPGLSWAQKSYTLKQTSDSLSALNQHNRNDYLQGSLSLGAHYAFKIGKQPLTYQHLMNIAAWAGLYRGYWVDGHVNGGLANLLNPAAPNPQTYTYSEAYTFDNRRDNRWEWGWQAGIRIGLDAGDFCMPFLAVRIYQSLSDQQKDYMLQQVPRYNETLTFALGFKTKIGKK